MFERLAKFQFSKPWLIIVLSLVLAGLSLPFVLQLGVKSNWEALLPDDKPSVRDLELTKGRLGGLSTLTIALHSKDTSALKKLTFALGPELEKLENNHVFKVDWNAKQYQDFFSKNKLLYADLEDIEEVHDVLQERSDFERNKNNPFFVRLDNEPPPSPKDVLERLEKKEEKQRQKVAKDPDGLFVHPDGKLVVLFLRTDIAGGDLKSIKTLKAQVLEIATQLNYKSYAEDVFVEFFGPLIQAGEETDAIKTELILATSVTILLVLFCIVLFFRSFRSVPVLGFSLLIPVTISFGFAEWTVDYLNTSTAFLGSIIIGNGINPNVIWLARYFEERRSGKDILPSLIQTHRETWLATFTASMAASIAYGSLTITDFRGFKDFGLIGSFGMIACWMGAVVLLPAVIIASERVSAIRPFERKGRIKMAQGVFKAVHRFQKQNLFLSLTLTATSIVIIVIAVLSDPIEYDFRKLRSIRAKKENTTGLSKKVIESSSNTSSGHGIVVLTNAPNQIGQYASALETKRSESGNAPYGKLRTIEDLLPKDQKEKISLLKKIRELMMDIRPQVTDEDKQLIDEHLPRKDLSLVNINDLPEQIARPFTERDGTRGRIMYVESNKNRSTWDGRYLIEWTHALRETQIQNNYRPALAGRAPVFADIVEAIWKDGPIAIILSFLATFVLLMVSFRSHIYRFATLATLLFGIAWMGAAMALFGMKLNFLNFVAFPITFGNGVDYGVNVMRRFITESKRQNVKESVKASIVGSGGAVALCSLTTIIGYFSLMLSKNQAINSFGLAMVISEITCLVAAVIALPSFLLWFNRAAKK